MTDEQFGFVSVDGVKWGTAVISDRGRGSSPETKGISGERLNFPKGSGQLPMYTLLLSQ